MTDPQPYDPYDASQYDDLDTYAAVIYAWTDQWPDPDWRTTCMKEVRDLMPALARSLDRLVSRYEAVQASLSSRDVPRGLPLLDQQPTDVTEDVVEALVEEALIDEMMEAGEEVEVVGPPQPTYEEHLMLSNYDLAEDNDDWLAREVNPDIPTMTIEELSARARRATARLALWRRRGPERDSAKREAAVREKIIIALNNRDGLSQRDIGEMVGVTSGRIAQIVGRYYNRLKEQEQLQKAKS